MKVRPFFLMIITLLIGFLLGILTSAQLRHKRMKPLRIYSSEQQFRDNTFRLIEPDEKQLEVLDEIISRYGKEGSELQRNFRREFDALMNNYWSELKPELTDEQLNRMDEILKERRDAMRRFRSDSTELGRGPSSNNRRHGQRGVRRSLPCDSIIKSDSVRSGV